MPALSYSNLVIASLIGHVFGDGYISAKKRQFEYINFDSNLRSIAEKEVYDAFRIQPISRKEKSIVFPSITGDILLAFGCLVSPKLYSTARVPEWIMNGTPEMKKAFLRAIFDDDGSVMFSENYKAKGGEVVYSLEEALSLVKNKEGEAFIFGGAEIFKLGIPYADKMYLSYIKQEYEGDTFFPNFNKEQWEIESTQDYPEFEFVILKRK